jgi:transcriptional regulator with XRE-family HTH domain
VETDQRRGEWVPDLKNIVGDRIKRLRVQNSWNQEELAHRADMNRTYIGQIERGESSATVDVLEKITAALNITVEELFKDLQPPLGQTDNFTFASILNILNSTNEEKQKIILKAINCLLEWETKK